MHEIADQDVVGSTPIPRGGYFYSSMPEDYFLHVITGAKPAVITNLRFTFLCAPACS